MQTPLASNRIASIDILRALTMVLMIFVNDLWSLTGIPLWLEHVPGDADGMGLADVVFPAFLFIVGMSLPFAVSSRVKKGENNIQIAKHIVIRSIALLVMGVFLVNGENINEQATRMPSRVWYTLSCTAFILIWNTWPQSVNSMIVKAAKAIGIIILLVLAILYRGGEGSDIHGFATYWWGILGLIGWAYLVCGLSFVFTGKNLPAVVILWFVFNLICVAAHAHLIPVNDFTGTVLGPLGDFGMPSLVIGGTLISMLYLRYRNKNESTRLLITCFVIAVALLVIAFATRPAWGISKIHATPSWIWMCSAITILTFIIIYWIADLKGKVAAFDFIKPAGTNTLLCYLIPYFAYAIVDTLRIDYPAFMLTGITGLIKCLLFALLVVWIAGFFGKRGLQLKL
jgi:heparan-alpha-glucosaminide N-acetyltransferase